MARFDFATASRSSKEAPHSSIWAALIVPMVAGVSQMRTQLRSAAIGNIAGAFPSLKPSPLIANRSPAMENVVRDLTPGRRWLVSSS